MFVSKKIKTFIINLEERPDRKINVLKEFSNYPEFDVTIVKALKDNTGSWGLWLTIKNIIELNQDVEDNYILICEDDHIFTENYDKETLFNLLALLQHGKADILLGGASWFETVLPVAKNLFWVKKFNGLQFTVIFKPFYNKLLSMKMEKGQDADLQISLFSDRCFLCYPYISTQKEFGYSDVTSRNNQSGYVTTIFKSRMEKLELLHRVATYYGKI